MFTLQLDLGSGFVDYSDQLSVIQGKNPVSKVESLYNDELAPVTGTAKVYIRRKSALISLLLEKAANNVAVPVKIYKDTVIYFTGRVRTNTSIIVHGITTDTFIMECVCPLDRLFAAQTDEEIAISNCKLSDPTNPTSSALHILFVKAGFSLSELNLSIDTTVIDTFVLTPSSGHTVSLKDAIIKLTRPFGYVVMSTAGGLIELYNLAGSQTTSQDLATGTSGNLVREYAINVRNLKYEGVEVTYTPHKTIENAIVFEDTEGAGSGLACSIPILTGEYYPENADEDSETYADFTTAMDSAGQSYDIISVTNPVLSWLHTGDVEILSNTAGAKRYALKFYSATGGVIILLRIVGTAIVVLEENKVICENVTDTLLLNKITDEVITTKEQATKYASLLCDHYKYGNINIVCIVQDISILKGEYVTISDLNIVGFSSTCRVIKVEDLQENGVYRLTLSCVTTYVAKSIVHIVATNTMSASVAEKITNRAVLELNNELVYTPSKKAVDLATLLSIVGELEPIDWVEVV